MGLMAQSFSAGECLGEVCEIPRYIVICGFPKIRGTFLGVPMIRIILFWGPVVLGNYHIGVEGLGSRF